VGVEPRRGPGGEVTEWLVRLADGDTIDCRYLVIGAGRDAFVPEVFAGLPAERVIHSTRYLPEIARLPKDQPIRVAVIGGAQSAAEMFAAVQHDLPRSEPTMIMRSIGLNSYETSKFLNELYYPSFVDDFFSALPAAQQQLLEEMHQTNYGGLTPGMLDMVYRQLYLERVAGNNRVAMITMTDVTAARQDRDEVVLTLTDRKTGGVRELRTDLVLLGTGFVAAMPKIIRDLGDALGLARIETTRHYRLVLDRPSAAACYLQGVNEATHGIPDSLLSLLATRATEIAEDIFRHRSARAVAPEHAHPLGAAQVATASSAR
jgi:L-ornithine N5-oxygenase